MCGLEADTIGGFNSMLKKQKKEKGEALVTTILFSSNSERLHDRVRIEKVRPLTEKTISHGGSTALLDAIGDTITHIGDIHKYARDEDRPEHTIFIITTDGMENSSHKYDSDKIKSMIERQKTKYGWEFLFLGAEYRRCRDGCALRIDRDRAAEFHSDKVRHRIELRGYVRSGQRGQSKRPARSRLEAEDRQGLQVAANECRADFPRSQIRI